MRAGKITNQHTVSYATVDLTDEEKNNNYLCATTKWLIQSEIPLISTKHSVFDNKSSGFFIHSTWLQIFSSLCRFMNSINKECNPNSKLLCRFIYIKKKKDFFCVVLPLFFLSWKMFIQLRLLRLNKCMKSMALWNLFQLDATLDVSFSWIRSFHWQ